MRDLKECQENLSGAILVAHPSLLDPNFRHTVILLSVHSKGSGALGVILNRPAGKTLGDHDGDFSYGSLADVPLYYGGPVESGKIIFTAWKWGEASPMFQFYFGLSPEKAKELKEKDPQIELRAILGYSGWTDGQLEGEIKQHAWLVSPLDETMLKKQDEGNLWRSALYGINPDLKFLADLPEDPSLN